MPGRNINHLLEQAQALPNRPGIYFFKDREGQVLYIGKAQSLRERIKSYFLPTPDTRLKTMLQVSQKIDCIVTDSTKEAAFLENNYIRQHQPRFNLRLKDDKSFPFLKITIQNKFPGIELSRRVEPDGARYFGPFQPAHSARKSIELITRHFKLRTCSGELPRNRKRPCLEYDMELCSGPCANLISSESYQENTRNAILFLEGKTDLLLPLLQKKMEDASRRLEFEQAAHWRDLIQTVKSIKEKPKTILAHKTDCDILGIHSAGDQFLLYAFCMRGGRIIHSSNLIMNFAPDCSRKKILFQLVRSFYMNSEEIPSVVYLPYEPEKRNELSSFLDKIKGRPVRLHVPFRGKFKELVQLAGKNAELELNRLFYQEDSLSELKNLLSLARLPNHIEGFDISNTGGDESVGSLVVFKDGKPCKSEYRKYKVKTVHGPNDVASLEEIISRRYSRLTREKGEPPDLILIDGGLGQMFSAKKALNRLGLQEIPVISLAKKKETVFTENNIEGINLPHTSPALKLLQKIRDEAHRFAVSFHRLRREKKSFSSQLDNVPGIGPKRKFRLLKAFDSIETMKEAGPEKLQKLVGKTAANHLCQKLGIPPAKHQVNSEHLQ